MDDGQYNKRKARERNEKPKKKHAKEKTEQIQESAAACHT